MRLAKACRTKCCWHSSVVLRMASWSRPMGLALRCRDRALPLSLFSVCHIAALTGSSIGPITAANARPHQDVPPLTTAVIAGAHRRSHPAWPHAFCFGFSGDTSNARYVSAVASDQGLDRDHAALSIALSPPCCNPLRTVFVRGLSVASSERRVGCSMPIDSVARLLHR